MVMVSWFMYLLMDGIMIISGCIILALKTILAHMIIVKLVCAGGCNNASSQFLSIVNKHCPTDVIHIPQITINDVHCGTHVYFEVNSGLTLSMYGQNIVQPLTLRPFGTYRYSHVFFNTSIIKQGGTEWPRHNVTETFDLGTTVAVCGDTKISGEITMMISGLDAQTCTDAYENGFTCAESTSLKDGNHDCHKRDCDTSSFQTYCCDGNHFCRDVFTQDYCLSQNNVPWTNRTFLDRIYVSSDSSLGLGLTAPDSEYGYGYKTEHYDAICSNILCDKIATPDATNYGEIFNCCLYEDGQCLSDDFNPIHQCADGMTH